MQQSTHTSIPDALADALTRLGDTHQQVAATLTAAGCVGRTTGAANPVAVWLTQQVPATAGTWGVSPGQTWIDERLFWRGQFLDVPDPVQDFFEIFYSGGHPHLRRTPCRAAVAA